MNAARRLKGNFIPSSVLAERHGGSPTGLHASFREGWASQLRGRKGPCDPGSPGARHGEFRDIPHHPARKKDRMEKKAGRMRGKLPFKEQMEEGAVGEGRKTEARSWGWKNSRLVSGLGSGEEGHVVQGEPVIAGPSMLC